MTKQKNILNEVKRKPNNKILLNVGLCEKPEMNFAQALSVIIIVIVAFGILFPLVLRAVDTYLLSNCEIHNDCSKIIRDINGNL